MYGRWALGGLRLWALRSVRFCVGCWVGVGGDCELRAKSKDITFIVHDFYNLADKVFTVRDELQIANNAQKQKSKSELNNNLNSHTLAPLPPCH